MPWVGNIAKTMTSNEKQFTVTREMLTAVARDRRWPDVVAGISARFSIFSFVLFCYLTNHLMTGPLWSSEFCFPWISMFPSTSSWETLRFSGNKIHCSPGDQSLSVNYWIIVGGPFSFVAGHNPVQHKEAETQSTSRPFAPWAKNWWANSHPSRLLKKCLKNKTKRTQSQETPLKFAIPP